MSSFGDSFVTTEIETDAVSVRILKSSRNNVSGTTGGRIELGTGTSNIIKLENLPTNRTPLETGVIYNDNGVLKIKLPT